MNVQSHKIHSYIRATPKYRTDSNSSGAGWVAVALVIATAVLAIMHWKG